MPEYKLVYTETEQESRLEVFQMRGGFSYQSFGRLTANNTGFFDEKVHRLIEKFLKLIEDGTKAAELFKNSSIKIVCGNKTTHTETPYILDHAGLERRFKDCNLHLIK